MVMISQEGAPSLKVLFQIIHIPPYEAAEEIGGNDRETGRFLYSSQIKEGNKVADFRCFRVSQIRPYLITRHVHVHEAVQTVGPG